MSFRAGQDDARAVTLARRAFLAGGPTHGVGFGLLIGALGRAGLDSGELPRPLAISAGRFPGLIVCGIAGARLSRPAA